MIKRVHFVLHNFGYFVAVQPLFREVAKIDAFADNHNSFFLVVVNRPYGHVHAAPLKVIFHNEHEPRKERLHFGVIALIGIFGKYHKRGVVVEHFNALFHRFDEPHIGVRRQKLHTLVKELRKIRLEKGFERRARFASAVLLDIQNVAEILSALFIRTEHLMCAPLYGVERKIGFVDERSHFVGVVGKVQALVLQFAA